MDVERVIGSEVREKGGVDHLVFILHGMKTL